jgi:hypothetical protein
MPQLPPKNSLDYNPNSIINASKKIRTIALERMKNPLEDPDQKTLSTLDRQKDLSSVFDRLLDMGGVFQSVVLRIQNLLAPTMGGCKGCRGGSNGTEDYSALWRDTFDRLRERADQDAQRFSGRYRDDDRNSTATGSSGFSTSTGSTGYIDFDDDSTLPTRSSLSERYFDDDRNSTATRSSLNSSLPSRFYSLGSSSYPSFDGDDSMSDLTMPPIPKDDKNWTSLIFYLITITRRMNIIVSSNIKPSISKLTSKQIDILKKIYLMVRSSYRDITMPLGRRIQDPVSRRLTGDVMTDPFSGVVRNPNPNAFQEFGFGNVEENLMRQNEYGDEILNTFNQARGELLLNLTVIINSWKQNTPTGQQMEFSEELQTDFIDTAQDNRNLYTRLQGNDDDSGMIGNGRKPRGRPRKNKNATLIGNGRNFYGDKINNSRDIPSLFSGAMRDCPTKYLL